MLASPGQAETTVILSPGPHGNALIGVLLLTVPCAAALILVVVPPEVTVISTKVPLTWVVEIFPCQCSIYNLT